jgi:[NiFe] hydrogenase small subunit
MEKENAFYERLESKGVSRRDFMKFCTFLTDTVAVVNHMALLLL